MGMELDIDVVTLAAVRYCGGPTAPYTCTSACRRRRFLRQHVAAG